MRLSVIIPVKEGDSPLPACRASASLADEVIVVRRKGASRAALMNEGARRARGEMLIFLHPDTILPKGWTELIRGDACAFRLAFDDPSRLLKAAAWYANLRIRRGMIFGDHCVCIRRDVLSRIGGFPDVPIMEDVLMSRKLRRSTRITVLRGTVITSARRFRRVGVIRQLLRNQVVKVLFACGASPATLRKVYG